MKRIISLIVVMAMMLASVLAIIPVSATASTEGSGTTAEGETSSGTTTEETVETFRLLPDAAYQRLKAEFEADGANTPAYEPSVTPFAPTNDELQAIIGGNRILSITLPIKNVKAADENGNINFTIKVFKYDGLVGAAREPISTHVISVKPGDVGLTAPSTDVHKFVEFELDTPIVVQEDEVIALMASGDQIVPAWANGSATDINTVIDEEFPAMRWFCANIGKAESSSNNFNAIIFYDLELEPLEDAAPVGTAVKTEADLAAMKIGGSYYLDVDNLTLSAEWASKDLKNVTFDGNGKTITLSGTNGLFGDVTNSTIKNFTLAGDVTATSGVSKTVSNVTYKNVVVSLTAINGGSDRTGALAMFANGDVTAIGCTNNANVTGGEAGGVVGKISKTGASLTVEKFTNNGALTGSNTAGAITGWTEGDITTVVDDSVNTGTIKATYVGGFIGAALAGTTRLENCVNGVSGDAAKGKIVKAGGDQGQGGLVGNSNKPLTVIGGANYADIDAGHVAGVVGCFEGGTLDVDGFTNYGNLKGGTTAAAIIAYVRGAADGSVITIENSTNRGTVNAPWAGGFIAALHKNAKTTFADCENIGAVSGNWAGGFIGEKTSASDLIMTDCTNSGDITLTGNNGAGGIAGKAYTTTATFTRVQNNASVTKTGDGWNAGNGGLIGQTNSGTYYFTDCSNTGAVTGGSDNKGGFIGYYDGSKVYVINGLNTGNISGTGNNGGFLGQAGGGTMYYENCLNTGNISSSNNTAAGIQGWGGVTSIKAVNVVNKGDITVSKKTKWASGLFTSPQGGSVRIENSANYGNVTANSEDWATGIIASSFTSVVIENTFNAGTVQAGGVYEFSDLSYTAIACPNTGLHADLLAQLKELSPYAELVEKDEWQAVVDAFAAAKAVYDNSEATTVEKKAALDLVKAAIADTNTYVLVDRYAVKVSDPSLTLSYSLPGAKKTDYIALVKKGATEATLSFFLEEFGTAESFDLFADLPEGTDITEGEYVLYLVSKDVDLADVIADPDKAYDAVEILIAVNVIYTAEEFMAIAGTDKDYILANDIAVEGGITFAGSLNGFGNTITLTGTKGLFSEFNGATVMNFTLASASASAVEYGVADTAKGEVTIDGVNVAIAQISNNDKAGSYINGVDDDTAVITVKNSTTSSSVYGVNSVGGVIGFANVKSLTLDNVVNNAVTVSKAASSTGLGGLIGTAKGIVTVKNSINRANILPVATSGTFDARMGGIIGEVADNSGDILIENTQNYGAILNAKSGSSAWCLGVGGFVGNLDGKVNLTIKSSDNHGKVNNGTSANKSGFVGMATGEAFIIINGCVNYGEIDSNGNRVGGFLGQGEAATIKIVNSENRGNINNKGDHTAGLVGIVKSASFYGSKNYGNVTSTQRAAGFISWRYDPDDVVFYCCEDHYGTNDVCEDKFNINYGDVNGSSAAGFMATDNENGGKNLYVVNCINEGNITATNGNAAGIILGRNNCNTAQFTNTTNNGNVTATGVAAGFIVNNWGNNLYFTNCVNNGDITSTRSVAIGFSYGTSWTTKYVNCKNYGDIVAKGNAVGFGLSGNGPRTYSKCENYGSIRSTEGNAAGIFMALSEKQHTDYNVTECKNYGKIVAGLSAAGIATALQANTESAYTNFNVTFTDCVNSGEVTTTSADVGICVAGIAGNFSGVNSAKFINCVNNGDIICPVGDASGIAGWGGTTAPITFKDCANYGSIYGGRAEVQITYTAGLTNKTFEGAQIEGGFLYNNDPDKVIEIWTAEEFAEIRAGGRYILMDDIVLPTDYESISFFGTYNSLTSAYLDGNGKTIYMKNLENPCALFDNIGSAIIKNLNIVGDLDGACAVIANKVVEQAADDDILNIEISDVVVDVDIKNTSGSSVGAFIAESGTVGTKVTNLTINDSKFLGSIDADGYAGGFVGYFKTNGNVTLNNCTVGDVALNTHINGKGRVAGFFAKLKSPADKDPGTVTATFNNCINYATISQVNTGAEGIAGGIIGRAQHITVVLNRVENYGDVSTIRPTLNWNQGTGGLVGEINNNAYLTILSSVNYGDVTTDKGQIGGFVGLVSNKSFLTIGAIDESGRVDYNTISRNFGSVTVGATENQFSGGIVGSAAYNSVDSSISAQNIGTANSIMIYGVQNYGDVYGEWWCNLGGIMGGTNAAPDKLIIIGAENYGDVESTASNVGGILGQPGASGEMTIKNCTNYGNIKNANANGAAGITSYIWGGTPANLNIINNKNYGTIESSSAAAGITMQTNSTSANVSGNENYGTVISNNGNGAGIALTIDGGATKFEENVSSGLLIGAEKLYKTKNDNAKLSGNMEYCAVVTDTALVELAKKICAADYDFEDFIGETLTGAVNVDLASQIYVAQNGKDAASDFEFFYELDLDAEDNTLGAKVYSDKNTAVPAMTYAAKLASISTTSYYRVTLDAKNNTNGTDSGFVYAIAPDGTVYSYVGDLDQYVAEGEEYGSYVIEYQGLNVTVVANNTVDNVYELLAEFEVAEGSFVAVGIANGTSDYIYSEETGDVVATPAENQNTATIANVTFMTSYYVGGIVTAFRALDTIDQNLANAEALAKTLETVLAKAQEECDAAAKTEENSALNVEEKAQALADATKAGKKDEELDPYEDELAAAIAVYERAHRDHEYREFALATAKANYEAAKADYDALKDSYKTDIANAKANVEVEIEAALNWAGFDDAYRAALALGRKFVDTKYDVDAFVEAYYRAKAATDQETLDAAVADMNNIVRAVDMTAYEYWLKVANNLKENDWTILTWEAFRKFIDSLDDADKTTQEKVDALTQQIIDEINKLVYDLELAEEMQTYLDEQLEERGWIAENYTPRSWKPFYATVIKPFQDAIDANAAATSSGIETTEQVLRAAYALFNDKNETTYTDLVYIGELNEILDLAKVITGETTTEERVSFSEISELYFLLAIPSAKIAHEDAVNEETTNEQAKQIVADALDAIRSVYAGLVDVVELEDAVADCKAGVAGNSYTVASWNAYTLALSKAEFAVVAAKTPAEVAEALAALDAAYDALVALGAINIDALDEAIANAEARKEADYTRESWSALEDALIDAKIAKYSDDQAVVEKAYNALSAALSALVLMPETKTLEELITEVEALKADEYTAKTWLVLITALQDAKAALSSESQEAVNEAKDALAAAVAELVKKQAVDTTAITALIAEIEALKAGDYTSETWANLKTALDAAKAALTSDEQTVVDVAKAALDAAKANLDKVVVAVEDTKNDDEEEEDTAPVQTATDTEKKGCGSAIGATVVVMTAVLGLGATVVLKKKED